MNRILLIVLIIIFNSIMVISVSALEYSTIIDLGTLKGNSSWANAINNIGYVRSYTSDGKQHPVLREESTGMSDLGSLGEG